jgi:hypothetical protein
MSAEVSYGPSYGPLDQQLDNDYYVHASDRPSLVFISLVLTHLGYHSWARSMRGALGTKNKFDFIDNTISIPTPFNPSYRA